MYYSIHQKQVLALFGCVIPFAMVDDLGWWAIPIVSLVIFTLYGIEGIGSQLEDPFGYDRNDIKMDAIVGDSKTEIEVVLSEWRKHAKAMEANMRSHDGATGHGDRCLTPHHNGIGGDGGDRKFLQPDLFLKLRPRTAA